ncbi:MAG: DNA methyltransferase [Desulfobacterales bacterium PC51MH44]|nr:MAG: DNA methyltransferase [Desulfobacterales bacterium PC51MH44]
MKDQQNYKKHIDLIWTIANLLRGPYRPPQYRRVMIPLTVLRRLDCVLEDSKKRVMKRYSALKSSGKYDDETIEKIINKKFKLNFFNVSGFTFAKREEGMFASLLDDPDNLAANLNKYIAGFSGKARRILEKFKFEEEIEKLDESNRLFKVIQEFKKVDFHPDRVSNVAMGYIFEDLVRRFNEQANEEAGDHFTPREVISLMVHILYTYDEKIYDPGRVVTIYDPTVGTGGMLSVSEDYIKAHNKAANLSLFGQEYNPESYAICGSDLMIKGEDVSHIVFGNTLGTGKSKNGAADGDGHPDKRFHYMLANPPFGVEWKPEQGHVTKEHNELGFDGRFGPGLPRINDGALLFLLHMISKMHPAPEQGGEGSSIGIVFNGSPLFTGDAGGGESNIRRWIIENDMLEAVIGLPDQLFYNTGIFTYIWIVTNRKRPERRGKVQLINAISCFVKMKKSLGNKRHELGAGNDGKSDHIGDITRIYGDFTETDTCKIFDNRGFGYLKITVDRPLRLNFQVTQERITRFKETTYFTGLIKTKKRKDKTAQKADIAAGLVLQQEIISVLKTMLPDFINGELIMDRTVIEKQLKKAFKSSPVKLDGPLKKAMLAPGSMGVRDPDAEIYRNAKGEPEPDPELRDTENVDLPKDIQLPLPLDYENKKTKGKIDKSKLLVLVQDHCEAYLKKEVLPYRPDAWIDHSKIKVGYEIPFNRHFYKYQPPRPLEEIEADIKTLETEIMEMLGEVTSG